MQTKIGIDILNRLRFETAVTCGGQNFLERTFLPQELRQNTAFQLVSIFCVKEALIKALELSADSWRRISTNRDSSGKIRCSFISERTAAKIISLDVSVSHDEPWVIAVAVVVVKE